MALVLAITNELNSRLLEKHRSKRVFGQIHGQDFVMDKAVYDLKMNTLTLRQGKEFFADREVVLFLFKRGSSFIVKKGTHSPVHVHIGWRTPGKDIPKRNSFTDGLDLDLRFWGVTNEQVSGSINLKIDGDYPTNISGQFVATLENNKKTQSGTAKATPSKKRPSPIEQITKNSPESVAKAFWQAVRKSDLEKAQSFAMPGHLKDMNLKGEMMKNLSLSKPEIIGNTAVVPTELVTAKDGGKEDTHIFNTMLALIDGQWKVDYSKTMVSLIGFDPNELMQGMKEGLESMGEAMKEGLEGMGEAMGEAMKEGFDAMKETTTDTHTEASWKLIEFSDLVHYENRLVRMENRRGIVREGILTAFSNGTASILKGRPSQGLSFEVRSQDIVKMEVFD
jgi:hypothetical protein